MWVSATRSSVEAVRAVCKSPPRSLSRGRISDGLNELVNVRHVVVHGEDLFEVGLVREHMDHPAEYVRMESSARGFTCLSPGDGTEHPEIRMVALIVVNAAFWGHAIVD